MEYTLEQIGAEMGLTREGVRQIEARAIRKLRARLQRKFAAEGIDPRELFEVLERCESSRWSALARAMLL